MIELRAAGFYRPTAANRLAVETYFDDNDDGATGLNDVTAILDFIGTTNPLIDVNCDGAVGSSDIADTLADRGQPPGPSGLARAGTPPCTR